MMITAIIVMANLGEPGTVLSTFCGLSYFNNINVAGMVAQV